MVGAVSTELADALAPHRLRITRCECGVRLDVPALYDEPDLAAKWGAHLADVVREWLAGVLDESYDALAVVLYESMSEHRGNVTAGILCRVTLDTLRQRAGLSDG